MTQLIHKELTYTIRGILFDVHNQLGPMLPETFYQQAVAIGLEAKGIKCQTEKAFEVYYREGQVGLYYVDLWLEDGLVLLELKVAPEIVPLHQAQAIAYLKVTGADLALVVNFGAKSLEVERLPNFVSDKKVDWQWEKRDTENDLLFADLTNALLEAGHRVHAELGPGFLHQVYRRAAMTELRHQGIGYSYIKQVPITYQGHSLGQQDTRLILVEDKVLWATVAVKHIDEAMKLALKSRLKLLDIQLGLIMNFNSTQLELAIVRQSGEGTDS